MNMISEGGVSDPQAPFYSRQSHLIPRHRPESPFIRGVTPKKLGTDRIDFIDGRAWQLMARHGVVKDGGEGGFNKAELACLTEKIRFPTRQFSLRLGNQFIEGVNRGSSVANVKP